MRGSVTPFLLAIALATAAVAEEAPAPRLEPLVPHLGQRAILTLPTAPSDSSRFPRGLNAAVRPTEDPLRFEVVPLRVGEAAVVMAGVDTLRWSVPATLDVDSLPEPRGLASVGILKPNWWPTVLLAVALLAPLAFLLWRRLRRVHPVTAAFPLVAESPHLVALRRLEELEAAGYPRRGEYDRFFVEGSHALRSYIAGRYRVPALDWTREELRDRLREAGYAPEAVQDALPLLAVADTVKFAAHRPTEHQAQEWLDQARRYIHATRVEAVFTTEESVAAAAQLQGEGA